MTIRDTRLQAAIVRAGCLLLVECALPDERPFWVLPGGGREAGETDAEAVAREVREELGVEVEVGRVIDDVPADPPDGTYARWRTFACRLTRGEPAACGADGTAELTAVRWLPLGGGEAWDASLRGDPFLYPQLERIRAALDAPPMADESYLLPEARMPRITSSRCVLAVHDLAVSTRFYMDVLGFQRDFGDGTDGWSFLSRDGFSVMLGECPDAMPAGELGDHSWFAYLNVEGVDALHADVAARGADILSRPATKPWGQREFTLRTPDGHRIAFGEPVAAPG